MSREGVGAMAFALFLFISECYGGAAQVVDPNAVPSPDKNNTVKELDGQRVVPDPVRVDDGGENTRDRIRVSRLKFGEGPRRKDPKETSDLGGDKPVEGSKSEQESGKRSTGGGGGSESSTPVAKEDAVHVEECDVSNRCTDEKNKFVACLRVPGNDSPTLSLLIQNKGTISLTVNIVAPDFVKLEQNIVQLQVKEDKKVKVYVEDGVNDTPIYLTAGDGRCNLSFWDMIPKSVMKGGISLVPAYNTNLSSLSSSIYVVLAAVGLLGAAWLWIRFRRMRRHSDGPGYQKLDGGMPVSSGVRESDAADDGWDDSWGDGWDDEEAPKTPSKPVSNPSSKGLASRRSNKDSWKD